MSEKTVWFKIGGKEKKRKKKTMAMMAAVCQIGRSRIRAIQILDYIIFSCSFFCHCIVGCYILTGH